MRGLRRRNRRRQLVMAPSAPADAGYLLAVANGILTNARLITASGLLVATDGGAGATYDIALDQADLILANLPDLDAELQAEYLAKALMTTNGDLISRASGSPARLPIGSTNQVLTVTAGLPSWANIPTQNGPPATPPWLSGQLYTTPAVSTAATGVALAANTLYLIPIYIPGSFTSDRIVANRTASGSGNYHLGIYGPATTSLANLPLIRDSGQIAMSGAGQIIDSHSQALSQGWYLLAILSDSTGAVTRLANASQLNLFGSASPTVASGAYTQDSQAYGNLPANSPNPPTPNTATAPAIFLRAA